MLETLKRYLGNGWVEADETWTYVSTDDPTGVFKVNADVTGKYSVGMRIKMTNGGNTIHGIITKMGTYGGDEAGYTYITFLHEIDPADNLALHLMANSAITNNYYSTQKAPFGFPLDVKSWTIIYPIVSSGSANYLDGGGAVAQFGTLQADMPIGSWIASYKVNPYLTTTSSSYKDNMMWGEIGISTANNSFTDNYLFNRLYIIYNLAVGTLRPVYAGVVSGEREYIATSKTTFYLVGRSSAETAGHGRFFANLGSTGYIKFRCAYL